MTRSLERRTGVTRAQPEAAISIPDQSEGQSRLDRDTPELLPEPLRVYPLRRPRGRQSLREAPTVVTYPTTRTWSAERIRPMVTSAPDLRIPYPRRSGRG